MNVIGYVRVSTDERGRNGYGLDAQRGGITGECLRRGWTLLRIESDVASGASTKRRPCLARALANCDSGEARALVAAKVDRLSRSVHDFAGLVERARAGRWNLVILDLGVDLSTPMGEAMASVASTFAQLERRLTGARTREGLAVARKRGVRLGRPKVAGPGTTTRRAHKHANDHAIDMGMKLPARDHEHHVAEPEKQR